MDSVTCLVEGEKVVRFIIEVPKSATVLQLKEKINECTSVPVARQTLLFKNSELQDAMTLIESNMEFVAGIVLQIEPNMEDMDVNITVTSPAFKSAFNVNQMDTVLSLKKKIRERWGFPIEQITLWRLDYEMRDEMPLLAYYIYDGSDLRKIMPVNALMNSKIS
ncbi:uncharacterized protein LOC120000085 [Tripterygium wilfordii]|uniref:uncharacterized protein LOC120000085 n=1 Tax=Tripterygium wilfordii TaxID=458696 RepID=UPI0018F8032E|nr:uncharacterized protein LOC120000085 [Tripterygium wilfordii]